MQATRFTLSSRANTITSSITCTNTAAKAQAAGELGAIYARLHRDTEAKPLLEKAYQNTQGSQKAHYANWLGNLSSNQHDAKQAQNYYTQAAQLAGDDKTLAIRIELNIARGLEPSARLVALEKSARN